MVDGEINDLTTLDSDVVRWTVVPVGLEDAANVCGALDRIQDELEDAVANLAEGRLLNGGAPLCHRKAPFPVCKFPPTY